MGGGIQHIIQIHNHAKDVSDAQTMSGVNYNGTMSGNYGSGFDGGQLTIPMQGQNMRGRGNTKEFRSNLSNHCGANNVLMNNIVDEMGTNHEYGQTIAIQRNRGSDSSSIIEGDTLKDPSTEEAHCPDSFDGDGDSDDTMMEKPRMHNYRSSTFMSNGGLTTISMDEEKLHKPPLHERRNKKNQDSTTGPNAYHSITDSQFGKLQKAISKAKSPSDFDKLENIIKNGQIPSKNWHGKGNNYNPNHYKYGDKLKLMQNEYSRSETSNKSETSSDDDIDEHIKNHKGGRIKSAKLPEFERGGNVKKNKFKMDENELAHKLTNVKKARNSNNGSHRNSKKSKGYQQVDEMYMPQIKHSQRYHD